MAIQNLAIFYLKVIIYLLENEFTVHPESVTKLLRELDVNKSMGPDGIDPKLLKVMTNPLWMPCCFVAVWGLYY